MGLASWYTPTMMIATHTNQEAMMTTAHVHLAASVRTLPFGGITLATCSCGARLRSDDIPITGGTKDTSGWYVQEPSNPREAYDLLQSEGYREDRETHDPIDVFDIPGNQ